MRLLKHERRSLVFALIWVILFLCAGTFIYVDHAGVYQESSEEKGD